ncbi:MAG: alpha/beta fold hydrolase, partial [Pseudomonadota bacterium]
MVLGFDAAFQKSKIKIKDIELAFWLARETQSPLALLLHGHTQSSEMWAPLANALHAAGMSVLALDLHGLGDSRGIPGRYDKKTMAQDMRVLIDALGLVPTNTNIIGHDLGAFAAYAYAAQFARQGDKLVMMDATVPGLGIWPMLLQSAQTWHFGFYGR